MNNTAMQESTNASRAADGNIRPVIIYYRTKTGAERSTGGLYNLLSRTIEVRGMSVPSRELDFWLRKNHNVELLMIEVKQVRRQKIPRPRIAQDA